MAGGRGPWFAALTLALAGCLPIHDDPPRANPGAPEGRTVHREPAVQTAEPEERRAPSVGDARAAASPRAALHLLAALPVRDRAPRGGYARGQYGPAWSDTDRNGCDTRNDVLRRDLSGVTVEQGTRDCVVIAGRLSDPYTGADVPFKKGQASHIDIDHVVSLGNAWVTGAAQWPDQKRLALANDPLNLLAVDASANRAKGDGDAADWLPPNEAFRCEYVARQVAVKAKYELWVTAAEHEAMTRVLASCPDLAAPSGDAPVIASNRARGPRRAEVAPRAASPQPRPPSPRSTDPDYGTCKNAKAHGAGPYHRDRDPEYKYYDDRDGDGVVCE